MRKIVWVVLSGLMVLSLVMAACGPEAVEEEVMEEEEVSQETPKYGGVLMEARNSEHRGWDDISVGFGLAWGVHPIYRRLRVGDWTRGPAGTGEFSFCVTDSRLDTKVGEIAESWEYFPEGRAIFKIRQGIHYGLNPDSEASRLVNGRELTAYDVEYAFNRTVFTPGSYINKALTENVRENLKITALDKYTLEIVNSPEYLRIVNDYLLFYAAADTPREVVEKYGDLTNWENIVGTGPFMISDYVPDSSTTYIRNPNYFENDPVGPGKGNQLPYLDGLKRMIIPDISTQLAALRTGKFDFLKSVNLDDAESLFETAPQLEWKQGMTGSNSLYLRPDLPELPYKDIKVRQALRLGIDYQAINKALYDGNGIIPAFPLHYTPEIADFFVPMEELPKETQDLYSYDPEKAKALLAEAGYPEGFNAKVIISMKGGAVDEAAILKDMLAKIGVTLELDPKEPGVAFNIRVKLAHENMYYTSSAGDAVYWYRGLVQVDSRSPANLSMIDEQYIKDGKAAMALAWLNGDTEEYIRISREDLIPRIIWESWVIEMPAKPIYNFWHPWLKNFYGAANPEPNTAGPIQYVWIDQDLKKSMGY